MVKKQCSEVLFSLDDPQGGTKKRLEGGRVRSEVDHETDMLGLNGVSVAGGAESRAQNWG